MFITRGTSKLSGGEGYPQPAARSIGGSAPFAQLGLSANVPFTAGVTDILSFDTIVYASSPFGGFETAGGKNVFFVPFGAYLAILQAEVDTTPTKIEGLIELNSNSGTDIGGSSSAATRIAFPMSAIRLASESPIPGHVLPCAVTPVLTVTGGGDGNILADTTKLFVWQLAQF